MIALTETDRRLADLLRYGTVASLTNGRVIVTLDDDTTTEPLQWFAIRAGKDRHWWAPEEGEQVMILSPSGELSKGTVLPSIFQDAFPENGEDGNVHRVTYEDGTVVEYDREAHQLLVNTSASNGNVVLNCGSGNVTVNCSAAIVNASESVTLDTPQTNLTGNLSVQGVMNVQGTGSGGGATSTFQGSIHITGGDVTADSIGLKTHRHTAQGATAPTTAAQP